MNIINTLPQYEPERLERSPIVLAVAQITFPAILSIQTDDKLTAQFQEKIRGPYPFLSVGHQVEFSLSLGGIQQQQLPNRSFQFTDSEQRWTVTLSANSIALETRHYTDANEFMERLLTVVAAAKESFELSVQERVGLRYINEIRHPEADTPVAWRPLIRSELLGPLADDHIAYHIVSASQELGIEIPEGRLTLRHGYIPQGSTVGTKHETKPPDGPFYLLDLDAFDDKAREVDNEVLDRLFRSYNRTIYSLFRWGISERLFEYLKGSE